MKKASPFAAMRRITPAYVSKLEKRFDRDYEKFDSVWGKRIDVAWLVCQKLEQMKTLRDELLDELEPIAPAAQALQRLRARIDMMHGVLKARATRAARKAAGVAPRVPKGAV